MTHRSRKAVRFVQAATVIVVALALPAVATAGTCPEQSATQAFSRFGDSSPYALISGGRFEGSLSWSRQYYAGLVWENNSYALSGSGSSSVRLRDYDTVTTPTFCVSASVPHMRFVARALNNDSKLDVHVLWTDRYGHYHEDEIAEIDDYGYSRWAPSPQVPLGTYLPTGYGASYNVRLRFSMDDKDGGWLIDDVYVDPRASR